METNIEQSELDAKINAVIAQAEGYDEEEPSLIQQEEFLKKYSFSALIFSTVYFLYMKDKLYFWLTIITGSFIIPLFYFPINARRRAWELGKWRSFSHFMFIQKKWDKAVIYGVVIFGLLFYLVIGAEIKMMKNIMNSGGINTSGTGNSTDLNQLKSQLQDSISN